MGNHDQGVGFDLTFPEFRVAKGRNLRGELAALSWTQRHTTKVNKKFLASLPRSLFVARGGFRILVAHALPGSLNTYVGPEARDRLKELHERNNADIYVLGHLHIPYQDKSAGALIINPGSVGKPKHNDRNASYAILELAETAAIEFCRVNYDIAAAAKKIKDRGLPESVAAALLAGK